MLINMMQTWITIVVLCVLGFTAVVNADNMKHVGSKECLIGRYCQSDNAVAALQREFGLSLEESVSYMDNREVVHSCSCHSSCHYTGLCCQDALSHNIAENLQPLVNRLMEDDDSYQCKVILGRHALIVDSCPITADPVISKLCATGDELDPLVTSNTSGLTYKSLYCGMCNGETTESLEAWSWNFDCRHFPRKNGTGETLIDKAGIDNCVLNATIPQIPPGKKEIHDSIGVYLDTASFCTSPPVASCLSGSLLRADCEEGPNAFVNYDGAVYKNEACLKCNQEQNQDVSSAVCESCENSDCVHPSVMIHNADLFASFGILVQPYNTEEVKKCKSVQDQSDCSSILTDLTECGNGQLLDYHTSKCKDLCPENYLLSDGSCKFSGFNTTCDQHVEKKQFLNVSGSSSTQLYGTTYVARNATSSESICYKCEHTLIVTPGREDYEITPDSNIIYKSSPVPESLVYKVDDVTYYACLDGLIETNDNKTEPTLTLNEKTEEIITIIFLTISIVSLLLYLAAYFLFKRLRNIPGKIVAGNMMCLLMAYFFFAIRLIPTLDQTMGCTVVAVLVHYFFLASFIFNIVYAGFIVHSLDFVDFESSVNKWTACRMWLIGLLTPFVVIAPAIILDHTDSSYGPKYGGEFCFIDNERLKLIVYFVAPIGVCLFISVCLYLTILIKLVQLAKQTSKVRSDHSEKITVALKLLIVLGFNWIFAIIAAADTESHVTTFIFIATCTLQGFFGFVVFICNAATLKDIKKCMNKHPNLPSFELSESSGTVKRTKTSDLSGKTPLRHVDSNKALLRTDNDNISV